jgi:hypothetical protein
MVLQGLVAAMRRVLGRTRTTQGGPRILWEGLEGRELLSGVVAPVVRPSAVVRPALAQVAAVQAAAVTAPADLVQKIVTLRFTTGTGDIIQAVLGEPGKTFVTLENGVVSGGTGYTYSADGATATLVLTGPDGTERTFELTFRSVFGGRFTEVTGQQGLAEDTHSGVFTVTKYQIRKSFAPTDVAGGILGVSVRARNTGDTTRVSTLKFTFNNDGTAALKTTRVTGGSTDETVSYTYERVAGNFGVLKYTPADGDERWLFLTFSSTRGAGALQFSPVAGGWLIGSAVLVPAAV